jgi:hypothetical protein
MEKSDIQCLKKSAKAQAQKGSPHERKVYPYVCTSVCQSVCPSSVRTYALRYVHICMYVSMAICL